MDFLDPRQDLYLAMTEERVNAEFMFVSLDDGTPIINCRLREWKRGNAADRMILAGGRNCDEALAYAYQGLIGNNWLSMDWSARAYNVGIVNMLQRPHLPVRQPVDVQRLLSGFSNGHVTSGPESGDSAGQKPAQLHQRRNKE